MNYLKYILILCSFASLLPAQDKVSYRDSADLLKAKKFFAEWELKAIIEPFIGIRSADGIKPGLFPIHSTGVSTRPVVEAALRFLNTLSPDQQVKTVYSVDDPEWRRWSNVDNGIQVRQGVSLKEMSETQRSAAMNLMGESLSAKGFELTQAIRKTDQTLREINKSILEYDEDLYFFTIMGLPSENEPWGWQVDGHHLNINYFILGDQVVMTPAFLGAEPVKTTTGKYKGNTLFQEEQDKGLEFYQLLDQKQRIKATLAKTKTANSNKAEAYSDNVIIEYSGISGKELSDIQQNSLVNLIRLYTDNLRDGHAQKWIEAITSHLDDTWFSWQGEAEDDGVFYYRIHSPIILIEFDHQSPVGTTQFNKPHVPTRDHIHIVVRTPNGNDYGKDLLRQHLEQHPH